MSLEVRPNFVRDYCHRQAPRRCPRPTLSAADAGVETRFGLVNYSVSNGLGGRNSRDGLRQLVPGYVGTRELIRTEDAKS